MINGVSAEQAIINQVFDALPEVKSKKEHVLKKGESLWGLAKQELGNKNLSNRDLHHHAMRIAISLHHTSFWWEALLGYVSDNIRNLRWIVYAILHFTKNDTCLSVTYVCNQNCRQELIDRHHLLCYL